MNYLQGLAIGHDEQYERFEERDAALNQFYEDRIKELDEDYESMKFGKIDIIMDDLFFNIFDDEKTAFNFGRLLFGLFRNTPGSVTRLNRFLYDEIYGAIETRFNNLGEEFE